MKLKGLIKIAAVLAAFLLAASFYLDHYWPWIFLLISSLLLSALVYLKAWFRPAFMVMAFLLPLSFSLSLSRSVNLVFPAEYLVLVLAPVLFIKYLQSSFALLKRYPWPALWLLSFVPSLFFTELPIVSLKYFVLNGLYLLVFYYGIISWRQDGGSMGKLVLAFCLGLLPTFILGFYNYARYDFNPVTISGIYEPFFYSHTFFGACLAVLAAFAWGKGKQKQWLWLAIGLSLITVISGSRAALWSLVFMAGLWGLMQLKPKQRLILPIALIGLGLSFGGLKKLESLFEYNQYHSHDPNASLVEKSMSVTNVQTDVSNIERLNRWVSALRMFEERPHFGFGPGTYQFTYIPFQEKKLENRLTVHNPDYPPEGSGGTAHSEWLLQLSENGWPSLLLFIVILGRWFYYGFWPKSHQRKLLLPVFLGLSTYYFHMHFNNFLNQPAFAFLFWSFGAVLEQIAKESKE